MAGRVRVRRHAHLLGAFDGNNVYLVRTDASEEDFATGEMAVDDEKTAYLGNGMLLEPVDTSAMTVTFKLGQCYPGSRYFVLDHSTLDGHGQVSSPRPTAPPCPACGRWETARTTSSSSTWPMQRCASCATTSPTPRTSAACPSAWSPVDDIVAALDSLR